MSGRPQSPIPPSALGLVQPGLGVPGVLADAGTVTRPRLPVPTALLTWPCAPGPCRSPFRPNLVSLDLSFNNLTDLQNMVAGLQTLKHLRLLLLQGNPLALVPHYRGFTIDSLARLCVLDDITVASSEKHLFRGLSRSEGEGAKAQGLGELLRAPPAYPPPYWVYMSCLSPNSADSDLGQV